MHFALRLATPALVCALLIGLPILALSAAPAKNVVLLTLDGPIGPATADYAVRGIRKFLRSAGA